MLEKQKQMEDYMEAENIMDKWLVLLEQRKCPNDTELEELGFTAASAKIKTDRELARKMRIAFEHFTVVPQDAINKFNAELYTKTHKPNGFGSTYDQLKFTPVALYQNVPPTEVLDKIRQAKKLGCFDNFEVATIQSVTVVPDPIVFGVINGDTNKYFVAQWDNDIRIEDILSEDIIN